MDNYYFTDRIFDEDTTNEDIFSSAIVPLVDDVVEGFNATILMNGISGTGKTHTMFGGRNEDGIVALAIERIFKKSSLVKASFLELYLDNPVVLIGSPFALNPFIKAKPFDSPADLVTELRSVLARRVTKRTAQNDVSSRSHAIITIEVATLHKGTRTKGRIIFADLAGNENAREKGSSLMKEGNVINLNLLSLKKLIAAAATGSVKVTRECKLTMILSNSFGENSKTAEVTSRVVNEPTQNESKTNGNEELKREMEGLKGEMFVGRVGVGRT
jgi:hypothetical protein